MGCDIHGWIELRRKDNGEWISAARVTGDRNYSWFSIIASVRGGDPESAIAYPRGVPSNASYAVKQDHKEWCGDAHSETFITVAEIGEAWRRFVDNAGSTETGELQSALAAASGNAVSYRDKIRNLKCAESVYDFLPEHSNIWEFASIDEDLNPTLYEDKWYDDLRMVVWFDN